MCRLIKREIDGKRRPVCVVSSNGDASAPNLVNSLAAREEAEDARRLLAESRAETRKLRADADAAARNITVTSARASRTPAAPPAAPRRTPLASPPSWTPAAPRRNASRTRVAPPPRAPGDARGTQNTPVARERSSKNSAAPTRSPRASVARVEAENRRLVAKLANLRAAAAAKEDGRDRAEAFGGRQGVTPGVTDCGASAGDTLGGCRGVARRGDGAVVDGAIVAYDLLCRRSARERRKRRVFVGIAGGQRRGFPGVTPARVAVARKARANTPVFGGGFARRKVPPRRTHVVALVSPAFGDP